MRPAIAISVVFIVFLIGISPLLSNQAFAQTMMSPRAQMQMNPDISELSCRAGYVLLTKADGTPACVSPSSYLRLVDRGWGMWDDTIMMNRPQMMNNLMGTMMQDPKLMQQWHDMMVQNQQQMKNIRNQWIEKLKENPQLMPNIMGPITTDPELRQQMISQMIQHRQLMQSIRNNTEWMGMMHGQMMGPGMGQGMGPGMGSGMGQGMGPGMGMQGNCPWCPTPSTAGQYGTATCPWCPVTNQTRTQGWMMHNPQQMQNMMNQVWQNQQWRQQMHEMMIQNPWHVGALPNQMMGQMMNPMMNDPELRQQMLEMIAQHQEFMKNLRENQQFQQQLNP